MPSMASRLVAIALLIAVHCLSGAQSNPDAKRLYDDLISRYNKLVRPVMNVSEPLTVHIKLKLSQLIEVIMTTNLWVEQYWHDYKLIWDPREYGGVDMLHVPSDHIWRPDIVLYNNADGNFEVTLATKAILNSKGFIQWKPPAIYKSSCEIDVEYFPFDEQTCVMKFGSWTYDGYKVDLRHKDEVANTNIIEIGIDLSEFYLSVEWDILEVPAIRNEKYYTCCVEPYIDITFNISMRRKTLFYTVNLIIPCMGISFLTVLVFYLPSDSGEKVALSISIFLSLTVFFLLLVEIIPPTSLVVPLLGKYLLFTMILVSLSICVTVVVLNVHFRSSSTHKMAPWVKRVFIHMLPRLLLMKRPPYACNVNKVSTVAKLNSPYVHQAHHNSSQPYFPSTSIADADEKMSQSPPVIQNHAGPRYKQVVRTTNGTELRENYAQTDSSPTDSQPPLLPSPSSPYHRVSYDLAPHPFDTLPQLPMKASPSCRVHGLRGGFPAPPPPLEEHLIIRERIPMSASMEADDQLPDAPPTEGLPDGPPPSSSATHNIRRIHFCPEFLKAMENVQFIANHTRESNKDIDEDWKYVAMVLDRLFLWIFTVAVLVGTCGIILHAPTLYDDRQPIDVKLSEVALSILNARRQG